LRLFQVARRFHMEVQPQLVLLQKTLLNIEGLGRQLYPELDLWTTAKPYMENWMQQQIGPNALIRRVKENLPVMSEQLPEVPLLAYRVLKDAADGNLKIQWQSDELLELQKQIKANHRQTITAISGGSMLVSGSILFAATSATLPAIIAAAASGIGLLLLASLLKK